MQEETKEKTAGKPEFIGALSVNSKGVGYLSSPERPDNDIIIPPERLSNAFHGDTVAVRLGPPDFRGRDQGQVVRIETRAREDFVGTVQKEGDTWYLSPDLRRIHVRFHIPADKMGEAKAHDKVVVRFMHWLPSDNMPEGEVVELLGPAGDNNTEMKAILRSQGLADRFPPEVEAEAAALPEEISKEEAATRRDFREVLTFTIDPDTAQDFDDALSFVRLPDGNFEIGIHIADVSHFVREGTALDREAQKRATSIYLVDRVIPMLPERLSNNLASLEEGKDRLTFSCVVVLTPEAEVADVWLGRGIIHSDKRFTYEEAQAILDRGEGLYHDELALMNTLAKKLSVKKFAEGAIAFEQDEVKFKLDEHGKPLFVYKKERGDTNKMIEDYMLLANRVVAEYVFKYKQNGGSNVFVYRIHDYPNIEKMAALQTLIRQFGHKLHMENGQVESGELSALLDKVQESREEQLIETSVMRSMAKAIYSTKNIGHYGLAFEYYTHFTSPIRRYPDVLVHRLLAKYLEDKAPVGEKERARLESLCVHCSAMERSAMTAEWDSIKLKQVEYMTERVGKVFAGKISGVTEYGMYVQEEESASEGMIRVREMTDDFYKYNEEKLALVGEKTKKSYRLGDKLNIKVKEADLETRTITYEIVD